MNADTLQEDIHNYEARQAPLCQSLVRNYGTAGLGLDLAAEAWPNLTHTFISGGLDVFIDTPHHPKCTQVAEVRRLPINFLRKHPVDLLAIGDLDSDQHVAWLDRVTRAKNPPKFIFEFWPENSLFSEAGPVSKVQVTRWGNAQYRSTCRLINSTQAGGVVDRFWLVVVR
jgi:hypothetical protein